MNPQPLNDCPQSEPIAAYYDDWQEFLDHMERWTAMLAGESVQ